MKTETLKIAITYSSNEYSDTPKQAILEISDADKEKVKLCKNLIEQHNLSSISIDTTVTSFLENDAEDTEEEESEWRADVIELRITKYGIYLFAQNKYDASDNIESENIQALNGITDTTTFTPEETKGLIVAYEKAVKEGKEQFNFDGNEYLTNYAKYLIQYLTYKEATV